MKRGLFSQNKNFEFPLFWERFQNHHNSNIQKLPKIQIKTPKQKKKRFYLVQNSL